MKKPVKFNVPIGAGRVHWDHEQHRWIHQNVQPNPVVVGVPPAAPDVDWAVKWRDLQAKIAREQGEAMRQRVVQAMEDPPEDRLVRDVEDFLAIDDLEDNRPPAMPAAQPEVGHPVDMAARAFLMEHAPQRLGDMPEPPWGRRKLVMNVKEGPAGFRTMTERSTRLPRFKLEYATQEEGRMRLEGTLVTVQDRMVKVLKVQLGKQDGEVGMGCIASDENGDHSFLLFAKEGMNFRSPDPGYIQVGAAAYHFRRRPARVYKQGISGENTYFSKVGRDGQTPLFGRHPDHILLRSFNERPVIQFHEALMENMESLRLSDRVAVFKKNGSKLHVEHRGHVLGVLNNGKVRVENNCVWVENALNAVGIEAISVEG